jgi:hypothetical protein
MDEETEEVLAQTGALDSSASESEDDDELPPKEMAVDAASTEQQVAYIGSGRRSVSLTFPRRLIGSRRPRRSSSKSFSSGPRCWGFPNHQMLFIRFFFLSDARRPAHKSSANVWPLLASHEITSLRSIGDFHRRKCHPRLKNQGSPYST